MEPGNWSTNGRKRAGANEFAASGNPRSFECVASMESNWVEELLNFLRAEPGVGAVRIDPSAHKVSVATIGNVDLDVLEEKLAETIAAIESRLASENAASVPSGYHLKQEG